MLISVLALLCPPYEVKREVNVSMKNGKNRRLTKSSMYLKKYGKERVSL